MAAGEDAEEERVDEGRWDVEGVGLLRAGGGVRNDLESECGS